MKEMVGGCCVCSDERGWPDNPLVYCDGNGCTVAVHQACYGIVTVPTGPWYCRKCESPDNKGKVRCELCPSKSGALKRADTGGWAHVVCALYIPEVRFGNVTSMEPIVLRLIPSERYNKTCYICHDMGKSNRAAAGACMQCNKSGCKQQFHVTCAQHLGLLCEEAGNYLDNVKYCGYCQHHYSKLKKGSNVKTVPPYKPVVATLDCPSSDSSGEREGDASPKAGGSGTPTHPGKAKGGGRKSSMSGAIVAGKSTPNSKTPTNTSQPMDKRKGSPARRCSSAGDSGPAGSGGSKASTPARSPQHTSAETERQGKGGSTPSGSKAPPPAASPSSPAAPAPAQQGSVISSVASATACSVVLTPVSTVMTSVLQSSSTSKPAMYQESVITNAEAMENRQTKKRKAAAAATGPPEFGAGATASESSTPASSMWESAGAPPDSPAPAEATDKIVKKAKTECAEMSITSHYVTQPPTLLQPPLPPPPHSPSQPSPRHLPSPMPGPSGVSQPTNIRSPSQPQGAASLERVVAPPSLLVSVPLPVVVSNHAASIVSNVLSDVGTLPHIYHQVQKQASMEQGVAAHPSHAQPGRSAWAGLNVSYEMQQEPTKQGGMAAGGSKDAAQASASMRGHKKRAAMDRAVAAIHNTAHHSMQIPGPQPPQSFSAVRRPPEPTPPPPPPPPPPPVYQETIKESPPSSPGSEKPLKPKVETNRGVVTGSCTGPHMLGNELNPASGAAARLQQQLNAELCAHAHGQRAGNAFVPPPLINKGAGTSRGAPSGAQSLDQLLERQWEQGSQFLMEQAQHFDIASLLSCLHQLRTENVRLEEHVFTLLQRRDHLLAVNARLAIPLTAPTMSLPSEPSRCPRENGQLMRAPPPPPPGVREPAAGPAAHAHSSALDRTQQVCGSLERTHQQACTTQERPHQMQMVREGQQKPS